MGERAALIGSPLAPVPDGAAPEWFEGAAGARLRAALFPVHEPRGSVVLGPGRTEPIEKYFEVVEELRSRGLTVLVHDWRGHGLSARCHRDGMRGHANGVGPFLEDFRRLLDAFGPRLPRPWIALGHSMGGGLTALALAEGVGRFDAAVLTAPMLGLQVPVGSPGLAQGLARVFSRIGAAGLYALGRGDPLGRYETNVLTHDRARWERTNRLLIDNRQLQVAGVTWGWLDFAFELTRRLAAAPVEALAVPLLLVAAGQERLVDNAAIRAFATRAPSARHVELEGAYHEILMETDAVRGRFWAEFDALVKPVLGTKTDAG